MIRTHRHYSTLGKLLYSKELWKEFPQVAGKKVFVKPNLVVPATPGEEASCTRIEVVQLIIEKLKSEGCSKIVVGDCGFKDQWELTIASTGYDILPKKYGVELIGLMVGKNFHKFTLRRMDNYLSLFGTKFSDHLLECDLVINVPKLKVHKMALVTGAIKNMMGTITPKGSMHPRGNSEILHKRLRDLYFLTQNMVKFCLMDGIVGSEYSEHGGIPKIANALIYSTDMWEVDFEASQVMGIDPKLVSYLNYIKNPGKFLPIDNKFVVPFELPLGHR